MQGGVPGVSFEAPARNTFYACVGGELATSDVAWLRKGYVVDLAQRPIIPGAERHDSALSITIEGENRHIAGNGLPSTPTGIFPIPEDSPVYADYAEAEVPPGWIYTNRATIPMNAVGFDIVLPRLPVVSDEPNCVELAATGILLNGARIVDPIEVGMFDSQAGLPLDNCFGHMSGAGSYHHHAFSPACFDAGEPGKHSPLVGYAVDGFGVFGPQGEDGAILTNAELDECHGHTHEIDWDGDRVTMFHYHLNYEFPYSFGCFRGKTVSIDE
jgi:hypothetical protein